MTDNSTTTPVQTMLQAARHFIENEHPLFRTLNLSATRLSHGEISFDVTMPERYADKGHIHGGLFTILLDSILAYAVWTKLDAFSPIATINLKTDYFSRVPPNSDIMCSAVCEGIRDDIAYCSGRAVHATTGDLIAIAAGTFMVGTRNVRSQSRL